MPDTYHNNAGGVGLLLESQPWEQTILRTEATNRGLSREMLEIATGALLLSQYYCGKARVDDVLSMTYVFADGVFENEAEARPYIKAARRITETTPLMTPYDTQDILEARKRLSERSQQYTQLSEDERDRIAAGLIKERVTAGIRSEGTAFIIMGPPASGKSSVFSHTLIADYAAILVDADDVKPRLRGGEVGAYAGVVHEDSSAIANIMLVEAMEARHNIVLPIVGKTIGQLRSLRESFRRSGYTVHLRLVDLLPDEAAKRAIKRYYDEEKRFVEPAYVLYEVGSKPRRNYRILKCEEGFSSYEAFTTDGPEGQAPHRLD